MRKARWRKRAFAQVLLVCALGMPVVGPGMRGSALADNPRQFSTQEQSDLDAGKLVVRKQERRQGDGLFIGGLSWQVVDADVKRVWAVLSDVTSYPRFLPAVAEAKRVAHIGKAERIFIRHQVSIVEASYFVLVAQDAPQHRVSFRLDRTQPGSLSDAYGELRVTPLGANRSVISFAIMADVGTGLIAGLLRGQVHEWMLRVPEELKRYIVKQQKKQAPTRPVTQL